MSNGARSTGALRAATAGAALLLGLALAGVPRPFGAGGPAAGAGDGRGEVRQAGEARETPGPPAARISDVTEEIHGVRVADPYRWLEDDREPEVARWVERQNAYTASALGARPGRKETRRRLQRLLSIGTLDTPEYRGDRIFYTRREAGQEQPILYVRDGLDGEDRPLVDPNALRSDDTAAIDWWFPSEDGSLVAYGVSTGGDERSTLRVIEVGTGRHRPDVIPRTRYCSLAWLADNSGFYYTRYPAPGEVPEGEENYNRHLFFHRLGDDPAKDPKVFGPETRPEDMIEITASPGGRTLVVMVFEGWSRSDLFIRDLTREGAPFVPLAKGIDAIFEAQAVGGTIYVRTNWEAPRYRLFAVDADRPDRKDWRLLIPEADGVLEQAVVVGDRIVVRSLRDASSRLAIHDAAGRKIRDVPLPTLGTVESLSGRPDGRHVFLGFESFTVPPTVYRLDPRSGTLSVWEKVRADVDLSRLDVEQVFYRSKDGTRVPMFLVHRRGIRLDSDNPVLLYGYGGFNVSLTPRFVRSAILWLERGGVYARANLRGGGEYGEEWHRAGMLDRKQNVFDDFIAAAEWLIRKKYTRADRLAIRGGSNGGLLAGAVTTQRPDLFRAAIIAVPLLDMLRYHRFQIARLWIPEYGSAESPEQFRWLRAYSPYHNVRDGIDYPAVLLTTAQGDSRVDPTHAWKMAARLQAASASGRPVLLRTESRAGHGAGKPVSKVVDELTDVATFLFWQLGME
ncbi:MAG: prolyl oligopeptidase family protein [Acidobacteriota bacterium]